MLKPEEQMELVVLKKHGDSIRGLSRSKHGTVAQYHFRRYLRGGDRRASESQRRNGCGEARSVQGLHRGSNEGRVA